MQAKEREHPSNINYFVSKGEKLPCEDLSTTLVSCAQSFHWLNRDIFFKEVDRVLHPGGCVALYGYGLHKHNHPECNKVLLEVGICIIFHWMPSST